MASDSRSQYHYLSDDDFEEYKTDPEQLKNLNEFRKKDLKKKLAKFSLSENKFSDEMPSHSAASDELRLVIIGKTGQGKSATANTILGKVRFEEDFTASSVTRESRCVTELVDGRKISVMDTPGLQDTHQSNEKILKELARMTESFPDGVHAVVYVMNMADPRFTAEDKNVMDLIEKTYGGRFRKYCLLLFSHGDSALKDVDLDTFRKRQMAIVQATSGHSTTHNGKTDQSGQDQDQKRLANLLTEVSWRMLAIDNKTSIPFEQAHNRKQIVAMVDRMRTLNSPEIYTNDMFVKAQQQREAMRQEGLRKGWDPSIMSKVETILAANPDISREQLQIEISRQLHEENQDKVIEMQRKEEEFEKGRIAEEKRLQEQKRVYKEKRQAEEKERRKRQEKEDQERKDRIQKEERERQERREREDREWHLRQEQRVAEEREKHAKQMQLQLREREELDRRRKEQLEREELERQEKREREDKERERRWEKEREEREKAERERRQQSVEELDRCRRLIETTERLQTERRLAEHALVIQQERNNMFLYAVHNISVIAYRYFMPK